ncbi:STAS domain-containing protein [Georgenia daeguensis]|uniref:STAS domain-containing protein n=1 Tax=Georgenia daeguensis TaxID=908355 RepID=A0ABP8EYJ7_9MICO
MDRFLHGARSGAGTARLIAGGGERVLLELSGEVDAQLWPDLQHLGGEAERHAVPIDVDLRRVTFMDSTGISFLAGLVHRGAAPVRVLNPSPAATFLLEVAGLADRVQVEDFGGTSHD